ncbi:CocE/NonD family hydrolase [Rhodococcus fascians]|nr:CocE/NonD family hydrolase [Rhodococcus fascians]MBY3999988.1 CocE/NonD family hydrolase [Rhodococcus fascians]MBY4005171.1 CocE/NonD family hydrolase [Rhodococcus fascians]MBY4010335.1 CocE/NonD family hydrolase [Rhodococcus fascians]MBY4020380.1 CocE/NonD family hydrolase [Rhodococcus fascians]
MTDSPRRQINLRIPNGDGTWCVADIFVPGPDHLPVTTVVTRTMYGRSNHRAEGVGWARNGFAYIVADVRGRYDSDGTFAPYRSERRDGAALIDFAIDQPWSNGVVVAYGGSYAAYTAWAMAVERPASVGAVVSLCPSMELARTKFDPSGILRLYEHLAWWLQHGDARVSRTGMPEDVLPTTKSYFGLPVATLPAAAGVQLPTWTEVLARGPDHLEAERITEKELAELTVPSFHVGGWYDLVTETSVAHFDRVGSAVQPRPARRLMIGPWTHELFVDPTGQHGPGASIDWGRECVRWLRSILDDPVADYASASIFHRGIDAWTDSETRTEPVTSILLYATAAGELCHEPERICAAAAFEYDPADPYPSVPAHQDRSALTRTDYVEFTTGALAVGLHIEGIPEVHVTVATTAPEADWIVRLLHRRADGALRQIAYGAAVADARVDSVRIPLTRTAVRLERGSDLILHITGSDFPSLARNLNGDDRYTGTTIEKATQTVHVGAAATFVRLPVRQESP